MSTNIARPVSLSDKERKEFDHVTYATPWLLQKCLCELDTSSPTAMNFDPLFLLKVGQHTRMAGRVQAPSPGAVHDVRCSSRSWQKPSIYIRTACSLVEIQSLALLSASFKHAHEWKQRAVRKAFRRQRQQPQCESRLLVPVWIYRTKDVDRKSKPSTKRQRRN